MNVVVRDPGDGLGQAGLIFDSDLESYAMTTDPGPGALLDAVFASPLPVLSTAGSDVHITSASGTRFRRRAGLNRMVLSSRPAWRLEVFGTTNKLRANLSAATLSSLVLHSPAVHVLLALPRPAGTIPVLLGPGADLRLSRPADVPVRIEIRGSWSGVDIDGRRPGSGGTGLDYRTAGYESAGDRYFFVFAGDTSNLTIDVHRPNAWMLR